MDDMPERELKPCPFCGDLAWMQCHGGIFESSVGYRVECEGSCHAMTCYWHTREQAVSAWNGRAAEARIRELEQELNIDPYLTLTNIRAKAVLLLLALDTTDNKAITSAMIALTKAIEVKP